MSKKRSKANGEGTIFQRKNGQWVSEITLGRDSKTGNFVRKTLYGKTREEVWNKQRMYLLHQGRLSSAEFQSLTLGEWMLIWLTEYQTPPTTKPTTYSGYKYYIDAHIMKIGHLLVCKIKPIDIQRFYSQLHKSGRRARSGELSPKTVRNIHNILHKALEQAVDNGIIEWNPSDKVSLPKYKRKDPRVLSVEEQAGFLEALTTESLTYKTLFIVALKTGMRLGEILGSTWAAVSYKERTLHVHQSLHRVKMVGSDKTELVITGVKTASSERYVILTPKTVESLRELERYQIKQSYTGVPDRYKNLIFKSIVGTPLEPRGVMRKLYAINKRLGYPHINFHAFRHTTATRLLEKNVHPKIVQKQLGHSDIRQTLQYSHISMDVQMKGIDKLDL